MSELLKQRDPEILLRNAHRLLCTSQKWRREVLWHFVSEITSHGATYSDQICRELGWNPNALVKEPLPPRAPKPRVGGLDCGVDLRTGKGVCVCGRCSPGPRRESHKHE